MKRPVRKPHPPPSASFIGTPKVWVALVTRIVAQRFTDSDASYETRERQDHKQRNDDQRRPPHSHERMSGLEKCSADVNSGRPLESGRSGRSRAASSASHSARRSMARRKRTLSSFVGSVSS